jgi:hypothetical protein
MRNPKTKTYLKVGKGYTELGIVCLAQEEVPQTQLLGLLLELSNDRDDGLPSLHWVLGQLQMGKLLSRSDFLLDR